MNYDLLFTPMKIGKLEIKNRFVMPPMDSHYTTPEHEYSEQAANYYGERAKGGFGLIITEYTCVSEEGLSHYTQAGIYDDKFIPSLTRVAQRVHEEGGKIFVQLQHSGRQRGVGIMQTPPVGASTIPSPGRTEPVHELTLEEIAVIKEKFVAAAVCAQRSGFDGVEVHGAHGYLLDQFLSKSTNKRTDHYGGNASDRARLTCEIIRMIKERCGEDFPVGVRTSGAEDTYDGNSIEDAVVQCMLFEKAGADVIHVSHGRAIHPYYSDPGFNLDNVRKVKNVVSVPVIGIGRINDPTLALMAVKSGCCDFVALGRQSIADSHFPEKVKEGRLDEIMTCTGCMQRCLYSESFEPGYGTSCMMNPFSGKEGMWVIKEAENKKKIGIVGAGPAGLQAAWILAYRGYDVTVFEKNNVCGGQYRLASMPPRKQTLAKTITTYLRFCEKYGVKVLTGVEATAESLKAGNFDQIIVAAGSLPIIPRIPGITNANVLRAEQVISYQKILVKQKVLVLGAGLVGAECAEMLGENGNKVTVVDMLDIVAGQAMPMIREGLLKRLNQLGVDFVLNSKVQEICEDGIVYENNGNYCRLSGYDTIVLAFGSRPNNALYQELCDTGMNVCAVGDAAKAADAKKAIFDATKLALGL